MIATADPTSFTHAILIVDDTPESPRMTSCAGIRRRRLTFLSLLT